MPPLKNTRQEAFAQARVAGLTIDAAYVEAGYKPNRSNAARMNANEHIQARIRELQNAAADRVELDAASALEEITAIAFSDIRDLLDHEGRPLSAEDLPDHIAKAIKSIKVTSKKVPGTNSGETVTTTEIKLWDKNVALEKLAKHLRLYDEKTSERRDPISALLAAIMDVARPLPVVDPRAGSPART